MLRNRFAVLRIWCCCVLALAVVGCGDDDSNGSPSSASEPAATATATSPPASTATRTTAPTDTAAPPSTSTPTPIDTATPTATTTATATPSSSPTVTETPAPADPGTAAWTLVPEDQVAERCGLDPALLAAADPIVNRPYTVVRYGQLCHEYYPTGEPDATTEIFSATKTLGALVTGIASYETRDLVRTDRKTGPLSDEDRVDHWLDEFTFNPEAHVAHVLAMLAHNADLSYGHKTHQYDTIGVVQINRLSDVINTALRQDPDRLGANIEEFTQHYLFEPLGMQSSVWSQGLPNKVFAFTWHSTVRDMARVGLLLLRNGVWSGQRILDESWVYKMTHPSFEDGNTGYGYLTWLNSASNYTFGLGDGLHQGPGDPCAPLALNSQYPHGLSEAPDCNYDPPYTCDQTFDVGVFYAAGLGGQYIVGHRGLDLVLTVKDYNEGPPGLWAAVRPALVALDPTYQGDEEAFCEQYGHNAYAPDLP